MAEVRERPYERSHFLVDLGGGADPIAARRVELPAATAGAPAHGAGDDGARLVVVRDLRGTTELYDWWSRVRRGEPDVERTVVVTLLNELREPVWSWRFTHAYPAVYRFSPLEASSSEPVEEIVEVAFDSMTVE